MVAIDLEQLGDVWSVIEPFILDAVEIFRGRHTLQTLISEVMSGDVDLWGVVGPDGLQALVGTQIGIEPSGMKTCHVRYMTGKHMKQWVHLIVVLEDYARSNGCQRFEAYTRKGMASHLPEYKLTHVMLEKDLI